MDYYFTSEIWYYPIKSCKGISISSAIIDERGIEYDRRWMIVDSSGKYITQRRYPILALVNVTLYNGYFTLNAPNMQTIKFAIKDFDNEIKIVTIWKDKCAAHIVNKNVDIWFSEYLKTKVSLVYLPDNSARPIDPKYTIGPHTTSFTDGFPLLLMSQSSLNDLNDKLKDKLLMNRFRPNIVIDGAPAFEEDKWDLVQIGNVQMHVVKPCARCVVTTTNQETAQKDKEPLKTLAKYRTLNGKIMFGQNLIHQNTGTIKVGYNVKVIKEK
jgi:uncharacterized protein